VDCAARKTAPLSAWTWTPLRTRAPVRLLRDGKLPEADSVRVEEFLNYFKQPYTVSGEDAFGVFAEAAPSPFGKRGVSPAIYGTGKMPVLQAGGTPALQLLKLGIKSRDPRPDERKPAMLTFVVGHVRLNGSRRAVGHGPRSAHGTGQ